MIFAAQSLQCFHCVDLEVINSSAELTVFMRRLKGSVCPLCGVVMEEYYLLADKDDVAALQNKTGPWNYGTTPSPGYERFFAEREAKGPDVRDVLGALRAQVARPRDLRRKEICRALSEQYSADFAFEQGKRAQENGDINRARVAYEFAAESTDDRLRASAELQLGIIDKAQGNVAAAATRFRSAATTNVRGLRSAALLYLGIALRELGDLDGARVAYQGCLDCEEASLGGLAAFRLGTVLEELGRTAEARDAYEFAVGLDSDGSDEAAVNLGAMEENEGRWERARNLWEYAFTTTDKMVKAHAAFNLGRAWEHEGDIKKAKHFYRIAEEMPDAALQRRARAYRLSVSKKWRPGR